LGQLKKNAVIMKKLFFLLTAFVLFSSHDMYLKMDTYFLQPNTPAIIKLFNGTFDASENTIARNRMIDVSLVGNGKRMEIDTAQWRDEGMETVLNFNTGEAGTWVAGVSTHPRNIEMTAADFNGYLEHDGVLDMLEWRKKNDALEQDAVEKYSKHVKTIFQVGDQLTNDWQTALGYPIEFVPLSNPYDLHPGHGLAVQLLWQGAPLANQLVYIGSKESAHEHEGTEAATHSHEDPETADHHHDELTQVRTNAEGQLTVDLTHEGVWYLRTIYLTHSEEAGLTHESNWATLTFEVGQGHSHEHEISAHSHPDEDRLSIPSYVYWIGSLVLIGILFLWFNRRN
jgi:hypothetical protein